MGQVAASDGDSTEGPNARVRYSFESPSIFFQIDADSGEIRVKKEIGDEAFGTEFGGGGGEDENSAASG